MADRLDGKVAIVTGGASGIGEGSVRLFAEEGARVVVADIQDDRGRALVESLGGETSYVHANVAMEADVRGAVEHAVERFGRLDAIFNNAGYAGVMDPIMEVDEADYDQTMDVLLKGVFLGIKHAARVMQAQGDGGSIVSTASVAGVNAGNGPSVYSLAKGAVIHLTRVAAYELGEHNIRVNCICPGGIATPIFGKSLGLSAEDADKTVETMAELMGSSQPIARSGRPSDIAHAALWLSSDDSSFVTGHSLIVDGGLTLGRLRQADFGDSYREVFKWPGHRYSRRVARSGDWPGQRSSGCARDIVRTGGAARWMRATTESSVGSAAWDVEPFPPGRACRLSGSPVGASAGS